MLKLFPLLLILFPFSVLCADEIAKSETNKMTESDSVAVPPAEITPEELGNTPRSSEFFFNQCYINVPPVVADSNTLPINQVPVNIDARSLTGFANKLIYQDDVNLTQGNKFLAADKLTYFKNEDRAVAEGNVKFVSGELTLHSDTIATQLNNQQTTLYQADYQFHGRGGRGDATTIYDNGLDLYEFNSSTYSACPPGDNTWTLDSTTLYIDKTEEVGSAYNAVLKIKDVPVFYFPYVTYPLTDRRKTGLLFPSFNLSDSTNGFTITQPLYINIAENMDATITPTYMAERGTLLATQYRYLFDAGSGQIQAEYLSDDKIRNDNRYLFHWDHNVNFSTNWNLTTDYSKVSDNYYFSDINTVYGTHSDNQLLQTAKLSYREQNWNSELEVRDFQILYAEDTPHKVMPKIAFSAYQPINWQSLQLDWYSEISKFDHDDEDVYTGTRIHLQPKISLPLYYNSLFINTELKYMVTLYDQTLPESNKKSWYADLDESVSRYLPSFKIHSGVNFERDFSIFNNQYKQTLVPQIQYLYVPYTDQTNIGLYDTTTMQQDYYGLFRDNRFSGYDRIADANQVTLGISSSFLNAQGRERMRFAVGQNYYLTPSETQLPQYTAETETASRSSIIGEFDVNFADQYFFHAGLEYDNDSDRLNRANTTFEKRWQYNTYAQLNYRYVAIAENGNEEDLVNQLGSKVNWSINSQWTSFASYYYDLEYKHAYESIIGLKYQSCCWSVGLSYDKHMLAYDGSLDSISEDYETEDSYGITFELMGLGGVGFSAVEQGTFDYGRPFYLQ
ncbi:MAG: LPS-assembly protein [Psychromonas sp.]|jgi:LPS-assembly protein|uniref:LPS assembly protein LptD n=1 Tax=Psychromonas sp. TaxID=1884585 RepID=UPI0039E398C1